MTFSHFVPGRGGVPLRPAPAAPHQDGAAAVAAAATVKHDSRDSTDSGVGSCGTGQETTTSASVERLNNIFNGWHSSLSPGLVIMCFWCFHSFRSNRKSRALSNLTIGVVVLPDLNYWITWPYPTQPGSRFRSREFNLNTRPKEKIKSLII